MTAPETPPVPLPRPDQVAQAGGLALPVQAALVEEATKRSGLVWVTPAGAPGARAVWHVWHAGAVWLLVARDPASAEQAVPGLLDAAAARVTVRSKDKGGRLVAYDATVRQVPPGSAEWDEVVPLLVDKRLNVPGGVAAAPERWRAECAVARLDPRLPLVEGPGRLPTGDLAAPVRGGRRTP